MFWLRNKTIRLNLEGCYVNVVIDMTSIFAYKYWYTCLIFRSKAKMAIAEKKSAGSGDESSDEIAVVLEKTKKVLSTSK